MINLTLIFYSLHAYIYINIYLYFNILLNDICFYIAKLMRVTLFIHVGALTSKPFAFWARSWELTTACSVDITDFFFDKIWVDLKNDEIMRILPWVSSFNTEEWISDKIWFSYDGFIWNWVIKPFFKNNYYLCGTALTILSSLDNLFSKYMHFFSCKFNEIFSFDELTLKNDIFWFYFSIFELNTIYYKLWFFFEKIKSKKLMFLNKNIPLFLFFWKNLIYLNLSLSLATMERYFFNWNDIFFDIEEIAVQYYKAYSSTTIKNIYFGFFENLFTNNLVSLTFSLSLELDIQKISYMNYLNTKANFNKFINGTLHWRSLITTKTPFIFFKNQIFDLNLNLKKFWNYDYIHIIGINIWLISPKLHLTLWKLFKFNESAKFFLNCSINNLLLPILDFGFNLLHLKLFLSGQHWLCSLYMKSYSAIFFFGENIFLSKNTSLELTISTFNIFLNKQLQNNYSKFLFSDFTPKRNSDSSFFYINSYNWIPQFLPFFKTLKTLNYFNSLKNNFFFNYLGTNINCSFYSACSFKIASNSYLRKFSILFEYAIPYFFCEPIAILPTLSLVETEFYLVNSKLDILRSAAIRLGPWLARPDLVFLLLLQVSNSYPFLWNLKFKWYIQMFIMIFVWLWLYGFIPSRISNNKSLLLDIFNENKKIKLNQNIFDLISLTILKKNSNNLRKIVLFATTSTWSSKITFVLNSRYLFNGFCAFSKNNVTFF